MKIKDMEGFLYEILQNPTAHARRDDPLLQIIRSADFKRDLNALSYAEHKQLLSNVFAVAKDDKSKALLSEVMPTIMGKHTDHDKTNLVKEVLPVVQNRKLKEMLIEHAPEDKRKDLTALANAAAEVQKSPSVFSRLFSKGQSSKTISNNSTARGPAAKRGPDDGITNDML